MVRRTGKHNGLMKVGEIAKEASVPPSTIRYYVKFGLLKPAEVLPSKYRLFDPEETVRKIRLIRELQAKKPTLLKISQALNEKHAG